jgi:Zn finger protein HypA/HybF involved in hydrogenase expression
MVFIKKRKLYCLRCTHSWRRRGAKKGSEVRVCPKCKSKYFHLPKGFLKMGRPRKKAPVVYTLN